MDNNSNKKRIGILDVFIIIIALLVIVSIVVRFISTRNSDQSEKSVLDDYIVTFKIMNIKDSSAKNYFESGTNFYLDSDKSYFGTLREGITVNDSVRYVYLHDGRVVKSQNNATGDLYRVDVEGSFSVKGLYDENGKFLVNGNNYISDNMEVKIFSKYLSVVILVTDISKAT